MTEVPFSYGVRVREIPAKGLDLRLVADPSDCAAIADKLGIPAIKRLRADITLTLAEEQSVRMQGSLHSDVVQTCTVTLEPVVQAIEETVDVTFLPRDGSDGECAKTVLLDPLDDDDYEFYQAGRIELAEILSEHLALGLDPYPRQPGSDFPAHIEDDTSDRISPFEGLRELKDKNS